MIISRQELLEDESKTNEVTAGDSGTVAKAAGDSRHGQSLRRRANPLLHSPLGTKTQTQTNDVGSRQRLGMQGARQRFGL